MVKVSGEAKLPAHLDNDDRYDYLIFARFLFNKYFVACFQSLILIFAIQNQAEYSFPEFCILYIQNSLEN